MDDDDERDFGDFLARRSAVQRELQRLASEAEQRADVERYSLLSLLRRLFVSAVPENGAARVQALRVAMTARADSGATHYDLSLGYDPLHPVTMRSVHDTNQFDSARSFLTETVLRSRRLRVEYGDDRNKHASCSVGTRPFLRISWTRANVSHAPRTESTRKRLPTNAAGTARLTNEWLAVCDMTQPSTSSGSAPPNNTGVPVESWYQPAETPTIREAGAAVTRASPLVSTAHRAVGDVMNDGGDEQHETQRARISKSNIGHAQSTWRKQKKRAQPPPSPRHKRTGREAGNQFDSATGVTPAHIDHRHPLNDVERLLDKVTDVAAGNEATTRAEIAAAFQRNSMRVPNRDDEASAEELNTSRSIESQPHLSEDEDVLYF